MLFEANFYVSGSKVGQADAGTIIEGKYRLERELGAGGMGSVWLATQLMVDRKVAVKLLHPAFLDQDELQKRFEVEAKAIGKLNHPNCITLYDFGYSEVLGAFYTVIEYIDGLSLDKKLGTKMTTAYVCNIIREVALALDHAHYHGILHRDLKPENVMLAKMTDDSEITKVLDFGIARIVKGQFDEPSDESQRITKAGEVFGTPAYMSPEQARSIRRLTPASDLYSLGVMFYELLTGELPFFANSAFDLLMLHVTKPVPPLRRSDVSDEVKNIIYRLLEKDPAKRFQSGKELATAIVDLDMSGIHTLDAGPTRQSHVETLLGFDDETIRTIASDEKTEPTLEPSLEVATAVDSTTNKIDTFDYADTDPSIDIRRESLVRRPVMTHSTQVGDDESKRRNVVLGFAVLFALLIVGVTASFALPAIFGDEQEVAASVEPEPSEPSEPSESIAKVIEEPKVVLSGNSAKVEVDVPEEMVIENTEPEKVEVEEKPAIRPKTRPKKKPYKRPAKTKPKSEPKKESIKKIDLEKKTTPKKKPKEVDKLTL